MFVQCFFPLSILFHLVYRFLQLPLYCVWSGCQSSWCPAHLVTFPCCSAANNFGWPLHMGTIIFRSRHHAPAYFTDVYFVAHLDRLSGVVCSPYEQGVSEAVQTALQGMRHKLAFRPSLIYWSGRWWQEWKFKCHPKCRWGVYFWTARTSSKIAMGVDFSSVFGVQELPKFLSSSEIMIVWLCGCIGLNSTKNRMKWGPLYCSSHQSSWWEVNSSKLRCTGQEWSPFAWVPLLRRT